MAKKATSHVYQIKVTLEGVRPSVWRRLLVSSSISLQTFHDILQITIGWTDSHLHQFEARGQFYGVPDPEFGAPTKDEARVRLDHILKKEKDSLGYEYDFGDGWIHQIVLEKVLAPAKGVVVPICVGGARACPLEDCGGIWGYAEFLKAIRNPAHAEHDEMLEWAGGLFDAEHFDAGEVNQLLAPRKRRVKSGKGDF